MKHIITLIATLLISSLTYSQLPNVIITEIMQNPELVLDPQGEYIELYNLDIVPVDINGMSLSDNGAGGNFHLIDNGGPLLIAPGGFLVLGKNADIFTNGGFIVDYEYSSYNLSNADDEVVLSLGVDEIDRVEYDGGPLFPDPTGASMSLNPDFFDAVSNDDGANWCTSYSIYGIGDMGTPGAANDECPEANDVCFDAIPLGTSVMGEPNWQTFPLSRGQSVTGCPGSTNADDDIWFSFVAQSTNDQILAQDPTGGYNAVVELYLACGIPMQCFNNYGLGEIERALPGAIPGKELTVGQTYYFRVYDAGTGPSASTDVRVQVKTFEDGGLRPNYCGVMDYELSDVVTAQNDQAGQLYSNPGVPVISYKFRFRETDDGVSYNGGLSVVKEEPNGDHSLLLADVPSLEYGKDYLVSVSHRVRMLANGVLEGHWSDFGEECLIGMQDLVPSTTLGASYCPSVSDLYLDDQINAIPVIGADLYRFTFVGPGGPFVKYRPNYNVILSTVGSPMNGLEYGSATYDVTVEARVNDTWSVPGIPCTIGMQAQPENTQILDASCGLEIALPSNTVLTAANIQGATAYQFRFTPLSGQSSGTLIRTRPNRLFSFSNTQVLFEPGLYSIEVRAFAGDTWGAFFDVDPDCTINIVGGGSIAPQEDIIVNKVNALSMIDAVLYPNPNSGQQLAVKLSNLSDDNQRIQLQVVDFMGKVVFTDQFVNKGAEANFILNFNGKLTSGIYFVNIYMHNEVLVEKFIVK